MESVYSLPEVEALIREEKALLIYFSSESCSVCKTLRPKVWKMITGTFPKMRSIYVDTERSSLIAGQHRVFSIPAILLFFEGKEHIRLNRNISLYQLEDVISRPYHMLFPDPAD